MAMKSPAGMACWCAPEHREIIRACMPALHRLWRRPMVQALGSFGLEPVAPNTPEEFSVFLRRSCQMGEGGQGIGAKAD